GESRLLASKPNELPVQAQERAGVLALRRNIDVPEIISDGQPGLSIGEPRTWGVIPLHGRALRIAAEPASEILGLRVLDPVLRNLDVMHPDLIPIVHGRCSAQGEQHHGRDARLPRADARYHTRLIVLA